MGTLGGVIGSGLGLAVARAVAVVVDRYLTSQGLAGVHAGIPIRLGLAAVAGGSLWRCSPGCSPPGGGPG